ncbi:MAG: hypothetical protein ABIP54_02225 [Candidatus Andersenbacteria bacterium]
MDFGPVLLQVDVVYPNTSLVQQFSGAVSTVTGTVNQINSTGGVNPVLSLSSTTVFPGTVTLNANPTTPLEAATKQYVDSFVSGFTFLNPCYAASTTNLNATYSNGAAGVGATLTNAGTQAAFAIDGVSPPINSRVLVKDQTTAADNGVYTLTTVGTGVSDWVLTRATDNNTSVNIIPGDFLIVNNGATNANLAFLQSATVTTVGTDPILWSQFGTVGTVTSVNGTPGQIVSTGGSNPTISIDPTYIGQPSITKLGTVTTGVWNATIVSPTYGGTGVNNGSKTITLGGNLTTAGAFNSTFTMTGATNVTFPTSGTLATVGGTVGSVVGTAGQIDVTTLAGVATVSIDAGYVGQTSITTLGTISTGTWNGNTISVNNGGTGATTFNAYAVICAGTVATGPLQSVASLGNAGYVLTSNGPATLPTFQVPFGGTVTSVSGTTNRITVLNGTSTPVIDIAATYVGQASITTLGTITTGVWNGTAITVPNGGTGAVAFTAFGVLCGGTTSTSAVQSLASTGTAGQVLASNGAAALPSFKNITSLTWVDQTGASVSLVAGTSYQANRATLVTFTLPVTAAFGDEFVISGFGVGGWKLAQNASQLINFGNKVTTTGTSGFLASTDKEDKVHLYCQVANTTFGVLSPLGNITVT